MNELSRSLLSAAREGLAPPPDVAARVRARVAASVGAPVAGAIAAKSTGAVKSIAATSGAATSGAATSLAGSSALKLGALAVIVGMVAIGVAHRTTRNDAPQLSISTTHDETAQPVSTAASHEAVAPQGDSAAAPQATPSVVRESTREPASLSREVELIDQAMSALRRHEPKAALAAMHTFDRETLGHAQMAEEAAAITIEAHCGLGDDVTDRLAAFDRTWPSSAERSRITDACR